MTTQAADTRDPAAYSDGRFAGILIGAASLLAVLMMAHHPVIASHDMAEAAAEIARKAFIDRFVHGTLIALSCVLLFGFMEFSSRPGMTQRIVRAGLLAYAIGTAAMIGAALISGFVVADLGTQYAGANDADLQALRHLLYLCMRGNQALANLGVIAQSIAIVLWSMAILRVPGNRAIAMAGLVLAMGPAIALLLGVLHLDVQGMLLVVVCNVIWNLMIAVQLLRGKL